MCVVLHEVEGSGDSAVNEFITPGMQLSAHFVVHGPGESMPDGRITQVLDTACTAYAQAAGNWPPTAGIAIETAGHATTAMTAAQCESVSRIIAWASVTHAIPIRGPVAHGTSGVTQHCNPDGTPDPAWGNHSCPGRIRLSQMPAVIARAAQISNPTPQPPPRPPEEPTMFTTDPTSGHAIGTDIDGNFYGGAPGLAIVTLPQHPEWKAGAAASGGTNPCVGIAMEKDTSGSWGYTYFTKPANGVGSWGPYNRYHINRNGSF
jgi:hypothetical protein